MIAEMSADYCAAACGATVLAGSAFAESCLAPSPLDSAAFTPSMQQVLHSPLAPAAVDFFDAEAASSIVALSRHSLQIDFTQEVAMYTGFQVLVDFEIQSTSPFCLAGDKYVRAW